MLLSGWLLATSFLIYRILKFSSLLIKISAVIIVILLQAILLGLSFAGFMFNDEIGFIIGDTFLLELLMCSLYRRKNISRNEVIFGLASLCIIFICAYFHGSVTGEIQYIISDAGGMHHKAPYLIYRWNTCIMDVFYPWFILFNIIISPFWGRVPSSGYYWKKLFN